MNNSDAAGVDGEYLQRVWIALGVAAFVVLLALILVFGIHVFLVAFFGVLWGNFLYRLSYNVSHWTRLPYGWSMALVTLLLTAAMVGVVYLFAGRINEQMAQMVDRLREIEQALRENPAIDKWSKRLPDPQKVIDNLGGVSTLKSTASLISESLAEIGLVYVLGLYFASAPGTYYYGIVKLFPKRMRQRCSEVLNALDHTLWLWTLGRLAAMAIIGVSTGIGLWLLGVPLPGALGLLAAIMTFIPNIGPFLAAAPAVLIAFQQGPTEALYVAILYIVVQASELNLVTPLIQMHQVQLPPSVQMISQMLLWWFAGLLGLTLATPIAALLLVLIKEVYVKDALGDDDISSASTEPVESEQEQRNPQTASPG